MKYYVRELAKTIVRNLMTLNKTLLLGIILFSSAVTIFTVIGSSLAIIHSEQPITVPFPPNGVVTDTCLVERDIGYLSLKVQFHEQGTTNKVTIPTHVLITGPDNKIVYERDNLGAINSFYGSKPTGTYFVTITSLEDQNTTATHGTPTIQHDLVCMTKDAYNLGQSFGGIMALGNLMYLVGFPIMIYGIIKERRIRKKQAVRNEYWKTRVQKHKRGRPLGVTALAIDSIIGGILLFLGSLVFASISAAEASPALRQEFSDAVREAMPAALARLDFVALASLSLLIGIVSIVEGYGLLSGRGWAWTLTLIIYFTNIGASALFFAFEPNVTDSNAIFSLAFGVGVSGLIIYYVNRQSVRRYFGRLQNGM